MTSEGRAFADEPHTQERIASLASSGSVSSICSGMLALIPQLLVGFSTDLVRLPISDLRPQVRTALPISCCEPQQQPPFEELTKVGSKAYYEGFFSQPIDESVTEERGDGTEQALKFAASSAAVIAVLFLGFMASNGLL